MRVGWVTIGGFDTHANEANAHKVIYPELAEAIAAFDEYLSARHAVDNVLMMTWSEFGRRVKENGSQYDHGTTAPLFVFGPGVVGGVHGNPPDLTNLDPSGNLIFKDGFPIFDPSMPLYSTNGYKWILLKSWGARSRPSIFCDALICDVMNFCLL